MKTCFKLILLLSILNFICGQNLQLNVQNTKSQNGPQTMGINIDYYLSANSNWVNFLERLGVNGARIFMKFADDVQKLVGLTNWGKDLNGANVVDQASFNKAVALLRSSNGRDQNYPWPNPIYWSKLAPNVYSSNVSFSDIIQKLNNLKISKLFTMEISCEYGTHFDMTTFDRTSPVYWQERYEFYKYSYLTAILARSYGVTVIEFMNEPDYLLAEPGSCMNASLYLEYYLIRSQSIQEAYNDMNADDPTNKVPIKISACGFSQLQFGGDPTRYLGDISVKNANFYYGTNSKNASWSNMQLYSYHQYSNIGIQFLNKFKSLSQNVSAANPTNIDIPVIVTEHNSHGGVEWNSTNTTADVDFEASLLASQIINFASWPNFTHYVFKFHSFEIAHGSNNMRKNGIHWSDFVNGQLTLSDTTLAAEAFRLLTPLKNSQIYLVNSNDVPNNNYRTYLASSNGDGNFYLYVNNHNNIPLNLNVDLSALNINDRTKIIVETVSNNYWGEISSIVSTWNKVANLAFDQYSTTRITIQQGSQNVSSTSSTLTCTAYAGNLNNNNYCSSTGSNQFIYSGTSNNASHETTSVALIKFPLTTAYKKSQRVLLNIAVDSIVGNQSSRVLVLGVRNPSFSLTPTSASWNSLSTLLKPLPSGTAITNVDQNFINWSSNANFAIAGHISVPYPTNNRYKLIDVTDYVNQMINSGASELHFVLYRPFRNRQYSPPGGIVPADDLSNGSLIKFYGASSATPPQLIYYSTN